MAQWNSLEDQNDLNDALSVSNDQPIVLFKHSTTCPISSIAKMRIEGDWSNLPDVKWYYLDLLRYRPLSNHIAENLSVHHESPQAIIVYKGEVIYDVSHLDISIDDLSSAMPSLA